MKTKKSESGQALVLIVFAIIGLIGFTALTTDGGLAYSEHRHAQNAADTSALAAALAKGRGRDLNAAGFAVALANGYDNNGTSNTVAISTATSPSGSCPVNVAGTDITVDITSHIRTYFAPVIGISQVTNAVTATARVCGTYVGPAFGGQAIYSCAPSGIGFDANGTPNWTITGGGIFSNSSSSDAAACGGSTHVTAPAITVVGGTDMSCGTTISGGIAEGQAPASCTGADFKSQLPPSPDCTANATFSGGQWHPAAGTAGTRIGSRVALSGDMDFESGLYCITNSPGSYNGAITGTAVTFYTNVPGFNMKFAGSGAGFGSSTGTPITAPGAGDYKGVLFFVEPQYSGNTLLETQALHLNGNGDTGMIGSIIAPSADITLFGNSNGSGVYQTQLVGYRVDTGGNADIKIKYDSDLLYQSPLPIYLKPVK